MAQPGEAPAAKPVDLSLIPQDPGDGRTGSILTNVPLFTLSLWHARPP